MPAETSEILEAEKKIICKKCHGLYDKKDMCSCTPEVCYNCCGCDQECDFCNCDGRKH